MAKSTIYLVTNLISGTKYVGFTSKLLQERIKTHKQILNSGSDWNYNVKGVL
jgi:hypothetical protein